MLATSRCAQCPDVYLLLLIIIPFALAGILLVALILVLNITIATGKIHGLIFYANILAANRAIFFPSLSNFLTVFVSWVNLDLGIETCLLVQWNELSSESAPSTCLSSLHVSSDVLNNNHFEQVFRLICKLSSSPTGTQLRPYRYIHACMHSSYFLIQNSYGL